MLSPERCPPELALTGFEHPHRSRSEGTFLVGGPVLSQLLRWISAEPSHPPPLRVQRCPLSRAPEQLQGINVPAGLQTGVQRHARYTRSDRIQNVYAGLLHDFTRQLSPYGPSDILRERLHRRIPRLHPSLLYSVCLHHAGPFTRR